MIEYVEIRDKNTRKVIGLIDTAKSIIWQSQYYSAGTFEVYAAATTENLALLVEDNYVTRIDRDDCGVIEKIEITNDPQDGLMIVASGRFCKSILDRRIVYYPKLVPPKAGTKYYWICYASVLSGIVETAVRKLIYDNAINAYKTEQDGDGNPIIVPDTARNIPEIYWTAEDVTGLTETIVVDADADSEESAEKQVTYKNLQEYTDSVLEEYGLGAKMWLDRDLLKFRYKVFKGVDRSRDNTAGNQPLIFSQDFDNLNSSSYTLDKSAYKTTALIGGEGEGTERKCAFSYAWIAGLDRRETFVDASNISSTYKDAAGEEQSYTIEAYRKMLEAQGRQTIAELQKVETFDGELDLTNSELAFGEDYALGDIITIEDNAIGKYINARILAVAEVQDDDGYKIDIEYGA